MMLDAVRAEVQKLLDSDNNGHGMEHVDRVYNLALHLAEEEQANTQVVALAALLHDADDYKLFGQISADNLTNANRIMDDCDVAPEIKQHVCEIIHNMGYSKSLKGIRPQTLEGKIVSDADMLDAIGAVSVVRTLAYTLTAGSKVIFNKDVFPKSNLQMSEYNQKGRKEDSFVNHFFDKLLKLKYMLFTASAKKEAEVRHQFMVDFLRAFFREQGCQDWIDYLEEYEKRQQKAA